MNKWVTNLDKKQGNRPVKRKLCEGSPPPLRYSSRSCVKVNSLNCVDPVAERLKKQRSEPLEAEDYMGDLAFLTTAVYLSVNVDYRD